MENKNRSYLVFRVGREWYGIAVESVIEVLHMVAFNEVPGTDSLGVMTLREQAIKLFDLRPRFGISDPQYKLDTPIIAVNTLQGAIGLVVDETDDVIQVPPEAISPYRNTMMDGVFRLNERMIFVLEISELEPATQF